LFSNATEENHSFINVVTEILIDDKRLCSKPDCRYGKSIHSCSHAKLASLSMRPSQISLYIYATMAE